MESVDFGFILIFNLVTNLLFQLLEQFSLEFKVSLKRVHRRLNREFFIEECGMPDFKIGSFLEINDLGDDNDDCGTQKAAQDKPYEVSEISQHGPQNISVLFFDRIRT
ncbi:MAG: hypothetical protein KC964_17770, partial [Candidatus Omnitrophica bacterium]|nr:hypothetical protein [Candidatus Omnitrophota bacterium]